MRKLYSLAVALFLATPLFAQSEPLLKTPEGKLYDHLYSHIEGIVVPGWTGLNEGILDGTVGKMVEDKDGNLYLYNPLAGRDIKAWVKLTKKGEGRYLLMLPQAAHQNTDDDDNVRTFTLNRLVAKGDEYSVATQNNQVEYTWDGKMLRLLNGNKQDTFLGLINEKTGEYYSLLGGVWAQNFTVPPAPIAPKDDTPLQSYTLSYKGLTEQRKVSVAFEGNNIFVRGFVKGIKDTTPLDKSWIRLTREGNKATFTAPQYLGIVTKETFKKWDADNNQYHAFAVARAAKTKYETEAAPTATFTIDEKTGVIAAEGILAIAYGSNPTDETNLAVMLQGIKLTPQSEDNTPIVFTEPAQPTLFYCSSAWNYDYTQLTTTFAFTLQAKDTKGQFLPADKLHYNIFVNGNPEPFTFTRQQYRTLEADLTNIPYNYTDGAGYTFKQSNGYTIVQLTQSGSNADLIRKLAVQLVYTDGDKVLKSQILETPVKLPTSVRGLSSSTSPQHIYQLDGRSSQQLMPSVNILRMPDGSTRKVLR